MRTVLIVIGFLCLMPSTAYSESSSRARAGATVRQDTSFDFRGVNWGASVRDVIRKEGRPVYEDTSTPSLHSVGYKVKLDGHDALLFYYFLDGKLAKGIYQIESNPFDERDRSTKIYYRLQNLLSQKYGSADRDERQDHDPDSDDLLENGNSSLAELINIGYISLYSEWKIPNTGIYLLGKKIGIGVCYESIKYQEELAESVDAESKRDL